MIFASTVQHLAESYRAFRMPTQSGNPRLQSPKSICAGWMVSATKTLTS